MTATPTATIPDAATDPREILKACFVLPSRARCRCNVPPPVCLSVCLSVCLHRSKVEPISDVPGDDASIIASIDGVGDRAGAFVTPDTLERARTSTNAQHENRHLP